MEQCSTSPGELVLGALIEQYESAQDRDGTADLAEFLPPSSHDLYQTALRELVRVDLEYSWLRGAPVPLADYCRRFPDLLRDPECLLQVTFEEFRLRLQAGQAPDSAEYRDKYGVDPAHWPNHERPEVRSDAGTSGRMTDSRALQLVEEDEAYRDYCRSLEDPTEVSESFPRPGSQFLGFRLLTELGRGQFGRVYLAQQGELAGRLVALKVISGASDESQTLAQLHHTNIVPIYSVHRSGALQAVCMPYLGAITLADILEAMKRQSAWPKSGKQLVSTVVACRGKTAVAEGLRHTESTLQEPEKAESAIGEQRRLDQLQWLESVDYPRAALWLVHQLADGLAHAHARGILHRDLKPANVLLTDDGQPLLLDFSLAADKTPRCGSAAIRIGGTLPYMAPEHLEALRGQPQLVDERSDLYALGVIFYELLVSRMPFPPREGRLDEVCLAMAADRQRLPELTRGRHGAISPAVRSILERCLAPAPARRYQSVSELREDLRRQLADEPLRFAPNRSLRERAAKWRRRHPRLALGLLTCGAFVGLMVVTLFWARSEKGRIRHEHMASFASFSSELKAARFELLNAARTDRSRREASLACARQALDRYQVLENPSWLETPMVRSLPAESRVQLRHDVGEFLLLWAAVATMAGQETEESVQTGLWLNRLAEGCYAGATAPCALWRQRADLARRLDQKDEERACLARAQAAVSQDAGHYCMRAADATLAGRFQEALRLLEQAEALDPQHFWVHFDKACCYERLGREADAANCLTTCIALWPRFAPLYAKRGLVRLRLRNYGLACADFDTALQLQPDVRDYRINRALARAGLRQWTEAIDDITQTLRSGTAPTRLLFLRARLRESAGDRDGALRDWEEGLRREPQDDESWNARGLARLPKDARAALADFDMALKRNPRSLEALQNKAHVLAEHLERVAEAVATLDRAVALYPDCAQVRCGRGVLLGRQGKHDQAITDARACLDMDASPAIAYQAAGIYALASNDSGPARTSALQLLFAALSRGHGFDLIDKDPDLRMLRGQPEFHAVVERARCHWVESLQSK